MLIFLIGMPGCGKTYWLDSFAEVLGYKAVDLDKKIEEKYQKPLARLFKNRENELRVVEKEILEEVIREHVSSNAIIATGGGTPCFFDNIELMKKHGVLVYLKADPSILIERLSLNLNQRPLLPKTKKGLTDKINELLEERTPYYEQADLIMHVKYINLTSFIDLINPIINDKKQLK